MTDNETTAFLRTLADHVAANKAFVEHVVASLVSNFNRTSSPSKAAAAPAKRGPGRPKKAVAAAPSGTAKRPPRGGAVEHVLAAIKAGGNTRSSIMAKSGVSVAGYSYALKTLKEKGVVKVQGTRGQAKIRLA